MFGIDSWDILAVAAVLVVAVLLYRGKKRIWNWVILGVVAGLLTSLFYVIRGHGFDWMLCRKIITISILLGLIYEISDSLTGYNESDQT